MLSHEDDSIMAPSTETEEEALQKVSLTVACWAMIEPAFDLVLTRAQKLRSALWFQIGKIVDDESIELGVNATPQFIGSLMELVWAQIGMS